MKSPDSRMGTMGWAAIGVGVIAFDTISRETLSCAYDRYLERHKLLAIGAVAVTGAHLLNLIPEPIDPIYQTSKRFTAFADKYL